MSANSANDSLAIPFKSPKRFLAGLDAAATASVIASAADVALIIDNGVIKDVAFGAGDLSLDGMPGRWRGMRWVDTVTLESKPKVEALLRTATGRFGQWREINHPVNSGSVPVRYSAVQAGDKDRIIALGRDLRSVSELQQRLVQAHQELERDYTRLREADARYRLLFQSIDEGVLIADAESLLIDAANPAALSILGVGKKAVIGAELPSLLPRKSARSLQRAVAEALNLGSSTIPNVELAGGDHASEISLSGFSLDGVHGLIVRLGARKADAKNLGSGLNEVIEKLPDALIVAGSDQRILSVNQAAVDMARAIGQHQLLGERLGVFVGRSPTDINVLITTLKNHTIVRNYKTVFRDQFGAEEDVEISGASAPFNGASVYGFSVRSVARRLPEGPGISERLPSSADEITGMVGRVPLKDIVRDATDLIEKLCIEAALEATEDNRASAAEMLGLSRQGLYSKLNRFGIDG